MTNHTPHRIAIFASGNGSNAKAIIQYFQGHPSVQVALIVCNKPKAGVNDIANEYSIPVQLINREGFYNTETLLEAIHNEGVDLIVLAGFLWLIPVYLINAFPHKIINIHPALLPDFGGKGMYGKHVHQAVIDAGKKESGITIHYVDKEYDKGQCIFQEKVAVGAGDNPESLVKKIRELEHKHYPRQIEKLLEERGN